jgi:hypothetical protein
MRLKGQARHKQKVERQQARAEAKTLRGLSFGARRKLDQHEGHGRMVFDPKTNTGNVFPASMFRKMTPRQVKNQKAKLLLAMDIHACISV